LYNDFIAFISFIGKMNNGFLFGAVVLLILIEEVERDPQAKLNEIVS